MAIKLEDVFACINKSAETNQDPGAQAMAAAAQAATPPGGIPLPKPIEQPKEEGGENMVPEEKLQAEKEKLEAQRRAELEKKENEIRGLQHELDLERVERQKATAENELKEKSRQQEEKFRQEREKLDAERQKLEQDKAMQSNTQQAELIKHQADMERETSKQVADIAQQKAKAIEDIAKQNAQQYVKTTQQAQQQTNRYFADQQKKFREENPTMSTALQSQIGSAVSAAKSLANHHRKIASYIPIPGSLPMEKKAAVQEATPESGVVDRTGDIENYSPANQARYIAAEIAQINELIANKPAEAAKYKPYLAKLNQTLSDIDAYVQKNRDTGMISNKELASYDLLTQKKTRTGRVGYSTIDNRYKGQGFLGWAKRMGDYINEALDNSSVELSDLDMIRQNGRLGTAEANKGDDWRENWLGLGRSLEDSAVGHVTDAALGGLLGGAVGGASSLVGHVTGWDAAKDFGSNMLNVAGNAFSGNTKGQITSSLAGDLTRMLNPISYGSNLVQNYNDHSRGNDILSGYGLSSGDQDSLRDEYGVSANPFWNTAGKFAIDATGALPGVGWASRAGTGVLKAVSAGGKLIGKANRFNRAGKAIENGFGAAARAHNKFITKPVRAADKWTGGLWSTPPAAYLGSKVDNSYQWEDQAQGATLARNTNDHLRQYGVTPGDLEGDELSHFVNTYQNAANNGYQGASGALKYFGDDIKRKQPKQYGSMFKSSATRIPIPGNLPIEKKATADDDVLRNTASGRNLGYSPNQLFSSTYSYNPFKQSWIMEKIEEYLPTVNMLTGGMLNFDYNLAPVFGRGRAPLDAGNLARVIYNTDSDPLLRPKKGPNNPAYASLKAALKNQYGLDKRQYTTIPTLSSNTFAIPKTN